ncbi:MAG: hypothetical protein ACTMH7_04110 [Leuconostoc fallax]
MMISGEQIQTNIVDEVYYKQTLISDDTETIPLDQLFSVVDAHIEDEHFMQVTLDINEGSAAGGTTLSIETNFINLPLRYKNALRKLIWVDKTSDINLYMIIENEFVSQSNLKIALASSVSAYQDDAESVKAKISTWFTEQLQNIAQNKKQSEEVAEADKEDDSEK